MNVNESAFKQRYALLNEKQQEAVDALEGPVMVIAGPGTGKTEVLGMRIANLLRSDLQVAPHEILCLTYTDEAAHNMRKRLQTIIGPAAQKVQIFTFHGFCNSVIQHNAEYFGVRQLEVISDLEKVDLMRNLLNELPKDHPMHRFGAGTYYDMVPLTSFFETLKKENWSADEIIQAIASYLESLETDERFRYKRKTANAAKGDLNKAAVDKVVTKMKRTEAAAQLYNVYNNKMKAAARYDFSDMLLWVIDAFNRHHELLQSYQERYQYVLVDEFQDTNGAQNTILNLLTEFWGDQANVFVVGDDDQSIYEFQGARIKNILDFYHRYEANIRLIVLTENYRSSQPVLDYAKASIDNNTQRLINAIKGVSLTKDIVSKAPRFLSEECPVPRIAAYATAFNETLHVVHQIKNLIESGVPADHIAVLYAQHKQADLYMDLLSKLNIPFSARRGFNSLDEQIPRLVLKIFAYLAAESKRPFSGEHLLFEILHAPVFGIAPLDLAALSIYLRSQEAGEKNIRRWRQLLSHEMLLSTMEIASLPKLLRAARLFDDWLQQLQVLRLPMLLEKIVYDSGMVDHVLAGPNAAWDMQVLQTFFAFVKEHARPQTTVGDLLSLVEKMASEGISVQIQKVLKPERGVQLFTAHSAKGLEFEYVFLIGCSDDMWENKRGAQGGIALPETLTRTDEESAGETPKSETARRAFYVALTRAKKHLYVSYPEMDSMARSKTPSIFIAEILNDPTQLDRPSMEDDEALAYLVALMGKENELYIRLADQSLLRPKVEQYVLSASSLNRFLNCPVSFYYEQILGTPVAENDSMAFGSAVHYALEKTFMDMQQSPEKTFPPVESVIDRFKYKMREKETAFTPIQYERRMLHGVEILTKFYNDNISVWHKNVQLELWMQTVVNGVPIKGRIDKLEILDGNERRVVDYKTGKPASAKTNANLATPNGANDFLGGDYWRQMVFYKILAESYAHGRVQVTEGIFEYVERDEGMVGYNKVVHFFPDDTKHVEEQIARAHRKIQAMEFNAGCGSKDCRWCTFVREHNLNVKPELPVMP